MSNGRPEPDFIYEDETLSDIIESGRTEHYEFFSDLPEKIRFAKVVTGLGNHQGGVIVLGVDKAGAVEGISDAETIPSIVADVLEEHTEPVPEYTSRQESFEGENIVIIIVNQYSHLPHAVTWEEEINGGEKETYYVFYKRRDISQHQIGPYEIWRLMVEDSGSDD